VQCRVADEAGEDTGQYDAADDQGAAVLDRLLLVVWTREPAAANRVRRNNVAGTAPTRRSTPRIELASARRSDGQQASPAPLVACGGR
jgi:hypothetical protein